MQEFQEFEIPDNSADYSKLTEFTLITLLNFHQVLQHKYYITFGFLKPHKKKSSISKELYWSHFRTLEICRQTTWIFCFSRWRKILKVKQKDESIWKIHLSLGLYIYKQNENSKLFQIYKKRRVQAFQSLKT